MDDLKAQQHKHTWSLCHTEDAVQCECGTKVTGDQMMADPKLGMEIRISLGLPPYRVGERL